jgi:N-acetyl-gamma-glutamyl-phosphate reductase
VTRVHVWGASGYAAAEAIRYLDAHPSIEIVTLESRSHAGEPLGGHFPLLRKTAYRFDGAGALLDRLQEGDAVVTAGGDGEARSIVPELLVRGARIVDLSADYRGDDLAVYGLVEWNRSRIAAARLVANPGCYPTASLLAMLPLAAVGMPVSVIVDAKSGVTGAGRKPVTSSLFAEVSGEIRAYGLEGHRHQPEITRVMAEHRIDAPLTFTPHVVPLSRGMLADVYAVYARAPDPDAVRAAYLRAYAGSPFVRMVTRTPSVAAVAGTNDAELRVDVNGSVVRAICAIDNLGKGAAGQAIQNLNLMLGYPEETGLDARAIFA